LLTFARDFVGARALYYALDRERVTWSTVLEPLVLLGDKTQPLDHQYVAGWLGLFPAADRTPYRNVRSVPPGSLVTVSRGCATIRRYWDFNPRIETRYRSDAEYEEHFSTLFSISVSRRLRSAAPVLAELSGGVDSSAIVCVADRLIENGNARVSRLDTVSYFDQREPHWDEEPYVASVEAKRGRQGWHIEVGADQPSLIDYPSDSFALTPGAPGNWTSGARQFADCLSREGIRVLLTGIGGDEFTGGVPTPIPELATLFVRLQLPSLLRQTRAWALSRRKPILGLAAETLRTFLPWPFFAGSKQAQPASWLAPSFVKRYRNEISVLATGTKLTGPRPDFQANLFALGIIRRQLACHVDRPEPHYERRYPFLDRDVLEFLFSIPREQVVRPGQRRSLLLRSLAGIVPREVLDRKRKSFASRAPLAAIEQELPALLALSHGMRSATLGFVRAEAFREALIAAKQGQEVPIIPLLRTIALESWLRHAEQENYLELPLTSSSRPNAHAANPIPAQDHRGAEI